MIRDKIVKKIFLITILLLIYATGYTAPFMGFKGLNLRDECAIPVDVGKTICVLFDKSGNTSGDVEIFCYFANSNEVPVIIGFADIMTKFKINIDYPNRKAFLD